MKKIITKEKREKRDTINKTIIGLLLVFLMVFSIGGYAFFSGSREAEEKVEYNGIDFSLDDNGFWKFEIQGTQFLTQYNPEETKNISVDFFINSDSYAGRPLYFSEQSSLPAKQEIARSLSEFISKTPQDACLSEVGCSENLPIKNCSQDNMIIIKESEEIEIKQEERCIFIFAPYGEEVKASDAFLFKVLGVSGFY